MTKTETISEPQTTYEQVPAKVVEFGRGSVAYSVIGQPSDKHNAIIMVNGFGNGRVNDYDLAELLSTDRQVLFTEQPVYGPEISPKDKRDPKKALEFQAEAVLAAALDTGLVGEGQVVNLAAPSLGGLIAERLKGIAKARGITSFDSKNGSRIVLLSPAGSNPKERLPYLGGRWVRYVAKGMREAKVMDPTGAKGKIVIKNTTGDVHKTWGEIRALNNEKLDYTKLGNALVSVYPEDKMFPYKTMQKTIADSFSAENPVGFTTPVNSQNLQLPEKRLGWALHHRAAGHDDPTNNPERTAKVILNYFDS